MGIPFFPWFTDAGDAASRRDVLDQKDAVRVRACWGGMTAFEAKWFQNGHPESSSTSSLNGGNYTGFNVSPHRFRYEEDPFWDASECCLIHADLTYLRHGHDITTNSGIFTNPYIRVAYDSKTLRWLPYSRRVERLYSLVHNILNHAVGMPEYNPRRPEKPGDEVTEMVWQYAAEENPKPSFARSNTKGSYHKVERVVGPGRFCGSRKLLVLRDNPKEGEKKWVEVPLPQLPS
jgi:Cryptococcal mannosyltransferase 1